MTTTSSSSSMQVEYATSSTSQPMSIVFDDKSFASTSLNLTGKIVDVLKKDAFAGLLKVRRQKSEVFKEEIRQKLLHGQIALPLGTNYVFIESSDSDFHYGAKRVVFIHCYEHKDGKEMETIFYKPHSIQAENRMFGSNSIFAQFGLPTLHIEDMGDYGIESDAGILKDIPSDIDMKYKMARCFELGKITALSELLGIGDLHMENIVLTKYGVTVIDGEFVFSPDIILGKISNCLAMVNEVPVKKSGDYQLVPSGGMLYCLSKMGLNYKKLPVDLFEKIVEGYKMVIQKANIIDFVKKYPLVNEIRITPLATGIFVDELLAYWDKNNGVEYKKKQILKMSTDIYDQIVKMGYWNKGNDKNSILDIATNIENSFTNGFIPRFSFLPQQNRIRINEAIIDQPTLYTTKRVVEIFTNKRQELQAMQRKDFTKHFQEQYHINYDHRLKYLKVSLLMICIIFIMWKLFK